MKAAGALLFGLLVFATSCDSLREDEKRINKPESMGRFAELSVIMPRSYSDSAFKSLVQNTFAPLVSGLPYGGEPAYKLYFTDDTYLKGYFILHQQVLMLVPLNELKTYERALGADVYAAVRQAAQSGKQAVRLRNVWSTPQYVQVVFAPDRESMIRLFQEKGNSLLQSLYETERVTGSQRLFRSDVAADTFFNGMLQRKGYAIRKKKGSRVAYENVDFCWLREQGSKADLGIVLHHEAYRGPQQFEKDSVIERRNRVLGKYIEGSISGTIMTSVFPPEVEFQHEVIDFKGNYATVTRGWWQLKNDFMGGPYITYTVYDKKHDRVITLEGNVFAPNEPKMMQLRELEVILHTFATQ